MNALPTDTEALKPPQRVWLTILVTVLVLVLLAAGYVQWRQYRLLDSSAHFQHDALGWSFSQLETEQLRLRNQMQTSLADPGPLDVDALQLRYDIFVSRIGLVDHERAARIMHDQSIYVPAMAQVHAFIAGADHYLGEPPRPVLTREALRRLLIRLDALNVPLHDLSLGASHLLYERATERNAAVRQQSRLGLALTAFQCLLLLVLAVVVLRQLRALTRHRRHLESLAASLGRARLEAESANRAKSVFLANMSHEIRTPFHGMLGMMSLLQDSRLTPQQAGFLDVAKESANHLLRILNDILDISQLESGKLQVVPEATDLLQLIAQVDALMRVQAQVKGLSLRVTVAPGVPRWVGADATRVKQILFNLLSNAVKFSQAGTIELEVAPGAPGKIDFTVRDPGIGMDTATLERLFQRFMQGDGSASRRQGGTGLGLQISRDLARLMDGDITVQSTPGAGSRFTVSLALAPAPVPVAVAAVDALPDSPSRADPRPLRVLVAEDHPVNRAYLEAVLDKLGHKSTFSEDGSGAVRAVETQDFDVVLMDLHMPGMDGFAAALAIRAMPPPRGRVPIIALTADAFHESREHARNAGMDGFLTKPAHLPQLREALERYVGGHAAAAPPPPEAASTEDGAFDVATMEHVRQSLSAQTFGALLAGFFEGHASASTELHRALVDGAHGELRSRAHALKGAALSLGLRSVADLAQQLQHTEVGTPVAELQRRLDALDQTIKLVHDLCTQQGLLATR